MRYLIPTVYFIYLLQTNSNDNDLICSSSCCVCVYSPVSAAYPLPYTYTGVEVKFKGAFYDTLISCSQVPELNKMAVTDEGLTVGASVTLTRLEEQLKHLVESLPGLII